MTQNIFYIWGYEEPGIAFEFKRQFELYFPNTFSKVAQVFNNTFSCFCFCRYNNVLKKHLVQKKKF
jgi:hypothetical protein